MSGSGKDIPEQSLSGVLSQKDKASMPDDAEMLLQHDEEGRENVTFPFDLSFFADGDVDEAQVEDAFAAAWGEVQQLEAESTMSAVNSESKVGLIDNETVLFGVQSGARKDGLNVGDILLSRYRVMRLLGIGGMGEVWRVFDQRFQRNVAMKVIRKEWMEYPLIINRFMEEAHTTAQLQHPGIISVHEVGQFRDGRHYFTMQEVEGITLKEVILKTHGLIAGRGPITGHILEDAEEGGRKTIAQSSNKELGQAAARELSTEWSLMRLIRIFERVCETLSFAHKMGVLHRDLKPSNIMLGRHGEVIVMDWGVAKSFQNLAAEALGPNEVQDTLPIAYRRTETIHGSVSGTPAFMSPEQALGDSSAMTVAADVFSLGCILYMILTGEPPAKGEAREILNQARGGLKPIWPDHHSLPSVLIELVERTMQTDIDKRLDSAEMLGRELRYWVEGMQLKERASEAVTEARRIRSTVRELLEEAQQLEDEAWKLLEHLPSYTPVSKKRVVWQLEERADELRVQAAVKEVAYLELFRSVLRYDSESEAHDDLAHYYHEQHMKAERSNELALARRHEVNLWRHNRGIYDQYLSGHVNISLRVDAEWSSQQFQLELFKQRSFERRLELELHTVVRGNSLSAQLPHGSYLCALQLPLQAGVRRSTEIRIPLFARRGESIDLTGEKSLKVPQSLSLGACFVLGSMAIIGCDSESDNPLREVWVESFEIQRHPISNQEYIAFLNYLVSAGALEEALEVAPRYRGSQGGVVYGFDGERFFLQPDEDGDIWEPDWPVILVSPSSARAYARYWTTLTGQAWRLPTATEWEKAARGVDGRRYPWGDHFDPTWACVRGAKEGKPLPVSIHEFPSDCSPYGMRGSVGNAQDICVLADQPDQAVIMGGAWSHRTEFISLSKLVPIAPGVRLETMGFRLCRSI